MKSLTFSPALTERQRAVIQNVNWLIDHPEQKPDKVTPDGQMIFHFRTEKPETKTAELKPVSAAQFDRMARAGAEKIRQKTGESSRKCIQWAIAQLLRKYTVKDET